MIEEEKHEENEENEEYDQYDTPPKMSVQREERKVVNRIKVRNHSVSNPQLTETLVANLQKDLKKKEMQIEFQQEEIYNLIRKLESL